MVRKMSLKQLGKERWKSIFTFFMAGVLIILFYFFAKNIQSVWAFIKTLNGILMPFILGFVMAYLLCPIYNWVTGRTYRFFRARVKSKRRAMSIGRFFGTLISLTFLCLCVAFFLWLLIPHLIRTAVAVVEVLPGRITDLQNWIDKLLIRSNHKEFVPMVDQFLVDGSSTLLTAVEKILLPGKGSLVVRVANGVITVARGFLNFLIGIIACAYFLNGKERFLAGIKRFIEAHFNDKRVSGIYDFGRFANDTFGGFITGKIIDSIIIGFICYGAMWVLKLPYAALISTIVGVTNVIPFFGPFIGAIPSAVIICVDSPVKALIFLIMILCLQQFDGNILGPFILGGRVGIASFWVMFSIIVGGGLFGVLGMLFAVPVFTILSYYLDRHTGILLVKKGGKSNLEDYMTFKSYGIRKEDEDELIPQLRTRSKGERERSFFYSAPVIGKIVSAADGGKKEEQKHVSSKPPKLRRDTEPVGKKLPEDSNKTEKTEKDGNTKTQDSE
ncbi:MAG: AI-2E family transporter [Eubacteriales bacterium]|nr:AI-2E family transporter [Eubacteriales bacterium]